MKVKAFLMVFEGIDGCGKTTLAKMLVNTGFIPDCIYTSEPTHMFEELKVLDDSFKNVDIEVYTSMKFLLDHAYHLSNLIVPMMFMKKNIICDRWAEYSSYAYQGPIAHKIVSKGKYKPDYVILLKVDIEVALKRITMRPEGSKGREFFEKRDRLIIAQERYDELVEDNWLVLDGSKPLHESMEKIFEFMDILE